MVKVISISDGVYSELVNIKGEKSFSQVILSLLKWRSVGNKEVLLSLRGKKDLIDERKIKALERDWRKWSEKYV